MWRSKSTPILVVDDDPGDRSLIKKMINKKYNIIEASDGKEALDSVCNKKPSLIIMDVMMPKMDGYSASCLIKKDPSTTDIPIIMLSGIKDNLNVRLAEKIGVNEYFTKPPSKQDLLDKIDQLLVEE